MNTPAALRLTQHAPCTCCSNPAAKSPKALYKQANKLIKKHKCGNNTDAEAERALEACVAALQQGEQLPNHWKMCLHA
jgi:hypothetical protein